MKTIYTCLPIYDRLSKQCFERAKKVSGDKEILCPTITPRHKLPAFQWADIDDACTSVTKVELIDNIGGSTNITSYFATLPANTVVGSDVYFIYNGESLKYLLPEGIFYLKITMDNSCIYYSEWLLVDCVHVNLISGFTNSGYDTLTTSGTTILTATKDPAAACLAISDSFNAIKGKAIRVIFYFTNSGVELPSCYLIDSTDALASDTHNVTAGVNDFELTPIVTGVCRFVFSQTGANTAEWASSEVIVFEDYSDKYISLTFEHSCDLGDIIYEEEDFQQILYLKSESMEPTFPYTEKGAENGYGYFVPTFQRQERIYSIKTLLIPQYIVDVLHRLKLHDTIILTDLVGDESTVTEIDVEHSWQFEDKYYALATIMVSLGEEIVVTGCCTAINECN